MAQPFQKAPHPYPDPTTILPPSQQQPRRSTFKTPKPSSSSSTNPDAPLQSSQPSPEQKCASKTHTASTHTRSLDKRRPRSTDTASNPASPTPLMSSDPLEPHPIRPLPVLSLLSISQQPIDSHAGLPDLGTHGASYASWMFGFDLCAEGPCEADIAG